MNPIVALLLLLFTDTQEAPKSLTIDSSSSLESLASVDNDFSHSDNELMCSTPTSAPKPVPKIPPPFTRTVLPKQRLGGAFTSYVRRRGEPDGRTADTVKRNTLSRPGGGESDAAFTPSPPIVLQNQNDSGSGSGSGSGNMALSLAHQTRIRNLYSQDGREGKEKRPDSSSSASSATDWDSGHATVLRRQTQQQITENGTIFFFSLLSLHSLHSLHSLP